MGMSFVKRSIYYFNRPGPVNTEKTIELAINRALELNIKHIVVPSLTGKSALKTAEMAKGKNLEVICVTFRAGGGFRVYKGRMDPSNFETRHWRDIPELAKIHEEWMKAGYKKVSFLPDLPEMKEKLRKLGVKIVIATDLGMGIDSSMATDLGVKTPLVIMKETLYLICPGLKVAVFSAITAADAGLIPVDREVISMGGTEQGLDTAIVVKAAYSDEVFNVKTGLEIREIICKPRTMMGVSGYYLDRGWGT